jgi:hypothetical protein
MDKVIYCERSDKSSVKGGWGIAYVSEAGMIYIWPYRPLRHADKKK